MMKRTHYVLAIKGGTEIYSSGPFETEEEQEREAKAVHAEQDVDDSVFWMDIFADGFVEVGSYTADTFTD